MKAVALTGLRQFREIEVPQPVPGKGEVLVRIRYVGICGSDVHYWSKGRIGSQVIKYPFIIGHECSGEIAETGKGVTGLKTGQRVAIEPAVSCGRCEFCLAGRPNICPKVRFLGTPPVEGAFKEYLVMPAENIYPLPDNIGLEEGVVLEPFSIGLYSKNLSGLVPGNTIGIMGCGPIGLSVLLAVKAAGAGQVFVTDLIEDRLAAAKKMGADFIYNADQGKTVDFIMEKTQGRGVDVTFEAAGEQSAVSDALASTRIGGKCIIIGIPAQNAIEINIDIARRREIPIINVRRQNKTASSAILLAAQAKVSLKELITHRFKLDEISQAFEIVSQRKDGVIKALIAV